MKSIYIFSGLGVDHRMFQHMNFDGYSVTHIEWIAPISDESIGNYAHRIANQIKSPNPILIGLSFGGVMAIEVGKIISTEKIILLASVKTSKEIPFYFRWMGKSNIHKLLPISLVKKPNILSEWMFDVKGENDKRIFREILSDLSPEFVRWAVDRLLHWDNTIVPSNLIHIHSKTDKVLPHTFVKCDFSIEEGGHFMTVNNANQISSLIHSCL